MSLNETQRRDECDPGVMLYGQGNLAQQALDQRRARSREIVLVIDKPTHLLALRAFVASFRGFFGGCGGWGEVSVGMAGGLSV